MSRHNFAERGFSLIELMISLTIGLFILLGVVIVYIGAIRSQSVNSSLARVQEHGRFATELMAKTLRQAGYTGCAQNDKIANVLNDTPWWSNLASGAILGYEGDETYPGRNTGTADGERIAGTDAIFMIGGDGVDYEIKEKNAGGNANFKLTDLHNLTDGTIVLICDPQQTTILQITNANTANKTIVHNTGKGTPGNCTQRVGYPVPDTCNAASGNEYEFPGLTRLSELKSYGYYIGADSNDSTGRSLYRTRLGITAASNTAAPTSEVLVPGIEDMQLQYGIDSNADDDVDRFVDADAVTDWSQVLAVRIRLLVAGQTRNVLEVAQTLDAPFTAHDTSDKRLRHVFTSTVVLRNRQP
ncbi:PilW family protein [Marinobacterium sp. D7]|uniref:PilW family protein n=1 Tax=Marinobacterium ramblicola TaxID=2849041 RepID=UPI001C2D405A|nr:PilW family protein [Marinobacterium ramblicola]MBV1790121.1 PilW family protein [Marinobacterium ramblicola]